jgi:large subunit ribosomal protein L11
MTYFIKKAAGITSGSQKTGITAPVAKINMDQVREIAAQKMQDLNANTIEAASQMVIGSARSMGVDVVEG